MGASHRPKSSNKLTIAKDLKDLFILSYNKLDFLALATTSFSQRQLYASVGVISKSVKRSLVLSHGQYHLNHIVRISRASHRRTSHENSWWKSWASWFLELKQVKASYFLVI